MEKTQCGEQQKSKRSRTEMDVKKKCKKVRVSSNENCRQLVVKMEKKRKVKHKSRESEKTLSKLSPTKKVIN